jgi:hypothetical protein
MSLIRRVKDYGFGMPYNGLPWNDPVLDDSNPGPINIDIANGLNDGTGLFTAFGRGSSFKYGGMNSCLTAYKKCPPLSSIINRKAQAHINGKMFIMNTKGKEATTEEVKKIRALMKKPNPLQGEKEFKAQQKIYMQLFGFCIVLPIIPAGFEKYGVIEATSLWNIPPYMIDVKETSKLFYQTDISGIIEHVKLNYKGVQTDLPLKNLGIFKDFTPSFNTMVFPESRVCLLEKPIDNIVAALESENEVISYAGSQGIITPDNGGGQFVSVAMGLKEKEQLQLDFKRQYGIRRGQFRYIISPAAIKWQSMGTDPRKLMLIEFVAENSVEVCNGYSFPPFLMGLRDSTYNNQNTAEKGLYQNAIIPEAESIDETWDNFFGLTKLGLKIETDYSHLPILQEDQVQKSTARKTLTEALKIEFDAGLVTINDWLVELGYDPLPGKLGDIRATDPKESGVPLAVIIGVGGVQGLIEVVTAQGMSQDARQATLEIVFGLSPQDAARMASEITTTPEDEPPVSGNGKHLKFNHAK